MIGPALDVSDDKLLDGRVSIRQPIAGYRAGMDAALIAAACDAAPGARVLDAGCGVGAAMLAAAARRPGAIFVGVEREPAALALALENIAANGLSDRMTALAGDVEAPFSALGLKTFDVVIANPPFFDNPATLRGPSAAKRGAWIADRGLAPWIVFMTKAVREGGSITLIHRADRLDQILALLAPKAGSFKIRAVHPFADAPAKRVLLRAIKTGAAPLQILPPLILHERGGAKYTSEAEAILRGEAGLAWR